MTSRLRHQLPVHSPLSLRALGGGLASLVAHRGAGAGADPGGIEALVRERFGSREVVLTDSGTGALTLALRAAARRRATPVALPAFCCYDVATAALGAETPVLLYDVDPLSLGPNFSSLQRVLQQGARTVVVAHLYGVPVDLAWVRRLADEHHALVVEDAAQGTGLSFGGRPSGAEGSLGVLSFGRGKGLTGGGGGALLANDAPGVQALDAVRRDVAAGGAGIRDAVATVAQWLLARPGLYALPASLPFLGLGETTFRPPSPVRAPSRFTGGVLPRTWMLADAEARRRRRNAARLLERLGAVGGARLTPIRGARGIEPGWLRLPVLVAGGSRRELLGAESRRLGIMPSYPESLADLPGFAGAILNRDDDFTGARLLARQLITLPVHGRIEEGDLRALERWIERSVSSIERGGRNT